MATGAYFGVGGVPRNITEMKFGVANVSRNVTELYEGINGVPKLVWSGTKGDRLFSQVYAGNNIFYLAEISQATLTIIYSTPTVSEYYNTTSMGGTNKQLFMQSVLASTGINHNVELNPKNLAVINSVPSNFNGNSRIDGTANGSLWEVRRANKDWRKLNPTNLVQIAKFIPSNTTNGFGILNDNRGFASATTGYTDVYTSMDLNSPTQVVASARNDTTYGYNSIASTKQSNYLVNSNGPGNVISEFNVDSNGIARIIRKVVDNTITYKSLGGMK